MPHRAIRTHSACSLLFVLFGCRGITGTAPQLEDIGGQGGSGDTPGRAGESGHAGDDDEMPAAEMGGGGGLAPGGQAGGAAPMVDEDGGVPTMADAGADPTGPPPAGKVGVFVAAGWGGRTVTSCDDGKTWIANHSYENSQDDHSPHTHKGLTYGNGKFVQLLGWGNPSSLNVSDDGVTWTRVRPFGRTFGAIGFDGASFVVFGQNDSAYATLPEGTWTEGAETRHGDHLRGGGGGPDGQQRGAVAGGGSDERPVMSFDGGKTWRTGSNCPRMSFRNLGQWGGVAVGNGTLVLVSQFGASCAVKVGGASQVSGQTGGDVIGKVLWTGEQFMAVSETRAFFSPDGVAWTARPFSPGGLEIRAVARSHTGTYVAVGTGGDSFYRSPDGVTWTRVPGPSGTELVDVQYGHVTATVNCAPAR